MALLKGKKAVIFCVANHRSITWAIAQSLANEVASLVLAYEERMERYVRDLANKIPGTELVRCDVQDDSQLDEAYAATSKLFGGELDILIHCVAFAPASELENPFVDTTRAGFH